MFSIFTLNNLFRSHLLVCISILFENKYNPFVFYLFIYYYLFFFKRRRRRKRKECGGKKTDSISKLSRREKKREGVFECMSLQFHSLDFLIQAFCFLFFFFYRIYVTKSLGSVIFFQTKIIILFGSGSLTLLDSDQCTSRLFTYACI